jgi:hypothetical protein
MKAPPASRATALWPGSRSRWHGSAASPWPCGWKTGTGSNRRSSRRSCPASCNAGYWCSGRCAGQLAWRNGFSSATTGFIAAAFLSDPDLWAGHLADPRFRGAYLRIAETWAPEAAAKVRDGLVLTAAERGDHTVSDEFIKRLEARRRTRAPDGAPQAQKAALNDAA